MQDRKKNAPASVKIEPQSITNDALISILTKQEKVDCSSYKGLNFDLPFNKWEVNFYPAIGGYIEHLNRMLPWYTQKHAANMLGISVKWYRAHITGERQFTLHNLARWSIYTGFPTYLPLQNTGYKDRLNASGLHFWSSAALKLYAEVSILPEYRFQAWLSAIYSFMNLSGYHAYKSEHAIVDFAVSIGFDNLKEYYLGPINKNMQYVRETCRYSIDEISRAMQISTSEYIALESGEADLKASDVLRFSMATGIAMLDWASGTLYKRIRERHNARLDAIWAVTEKLDESEFQNVLAFTRAYFQCAHQFPSSL